MSDQGFVIDLGGEGQAVIEAEDRSWLEDKLRREPGSTRLRLQPDEYDTEGHGFAGTRVRVIADDGDDTEGHAISIQFPTRQEADAFRKRLMLTGVIVGSVAVGAVTGAGLASMQADAGPASVSAERTLDANADVGLMDFGAASAAGAAVSSAATGTDANRDVGLMDFGAAAATASDLSAADQAYADRLSGQAAASDAARSAADQAWSDRLSGQAAADAATDADDEMSGGPSLTGPSPR